MQIQGIPDPGGELFFALHLRWDFTYERVTLVARHRELRTVREQIVSNSMLEERNSTPSLVKDRNVLRTNREDGRSRNQPNETRWKLLLSYPV